MKLNWNSSRREAFTLIELLAVIAIIGILFTLVSPQIGKARLKGKLTQQAHHAKSIVEGIMAMESSSRFSTGWPAQDDTNTTSSTEFLVSLVNGGHLDVEYSFFAGPGMKAARDEADFLARGPECNAWSIILNLNDATPGHAPAVFMSSYSISSGDFSTANIPIGDKGFVFATKNGEAVIVQANEMQGADFDNIFNAERLSDAVETIQVMDP
jgi:prepilin-type N-terminal cleavage/methylation domain-containing protein